MRPTSGTAEAAALSGIAVRTIERWNRLPGFQDAYKAASREKLGEAVARLRGAATEAVAVLQAALHDESTGNRIRAATVLLEGAIKVEIDDLGKRVEALEAAQQGSR